MRKHRYVSLVSVLAVLLSAFALVGLGLFVASFSYRWATYEGNRYDLINVDDNLINLLTIISIFLMIIFLMILLVRQIEKLNHSDTILVTLEYVDEFGNKITEVKEMEIPKPQKKDPGDRFQKLALLDKQYPKKEYIMSTEDLTLEYLCRRFRSFASRIQGNPLYYSIDDIRRFVAALGVTKIMILQGMSGTGKTSLPVAWGKFTKVPTTVVPVQPMWKERSDLIGYFNEFTGKFNESMILEKLYEANKTNKIYLIVLDEMNIARVEYYFAEFLSLLELPTVDERILEVTSSISRKDPKELHNGKLILPDNVYFIGTANNDDSTFAISDKVYDRSMIMNLDYRCEPFIGEDDYDPVAISDDTLKALFNKAKKEYALTKRGKSHIKEFDKYLSETFQVTFGNRIRRQIENYVPIYIACGGKEEEALDDILAKKVLRKLESQNPIYIKSKADDLVNKLNEIFGKDKMPVCEMVVRKMANNS